MNKERFEELKEAFDLHMEDLKDKCDYYEYRDGKIGKYIKENYEIFTFGSQQEKENMLEKWQSDVRKRFDDGKTDGSHELIKYIV